MPLNPARGNMYDFVDYTWNTVKGRCPHGCSYCYCTKWGAQAAVRLDEKELKVDLRAGKKIFVGSSCDMWAEDIPAEWIAPTLARCKTFEQNTYLFQSKNPIRIYRYRHALPSKVLVGATIESDRQHAAMGNAPAVLSRVKAMIALRMAGYDTMVTIEPVMDCDPDWLVELVVACGPQWVNIGANTHPGVMVPEPSPEKIERVLRMLCLAGIEVKVKKNLTRLLNTRGYGGACGYSAQKEGGAPIGYKV